MPKKFLKIHGNCEWYQFKQSRPAQKGWCSNKALADLKYLRLDPTGESCKSFKVKK